MQNCEEPTRSSRLFKCQGFVLFQDDTGTGIWCGHTFFRKLREQDVNFLPLFFAQTIQCIVTRLKAFRPCTIGQNDFMMIEQNMEVFDIRWRTLGDAIHSNKVLCSGQNFRLAEQ